MKINGEKWELDFEKRVLVCDEFNQFIYAEIKKAFSSNKELLKYKFPFKFIITDSDDFKDVVKIESGWIINEKYS